MSKKLIRKGLAISASATLAISGFSALPANAYGLADETFVELLPRVGTEYTVLHDMYFDFRANPASTISSAGPLKFLVEDTTAVTEFDIDVNGATSDANAAFNLTSFTATLGADAGATRPIEVTVTAAGHGFRALDIVNVDGLDVGTPTVGAADGSGDYATAAAAKTAIEAAINGSSITIASATVDTFTYTVNVDDSATGLGTLSVSSPQATGTLTGEGLQTKAQIEARALGSKNIIGTTVEVQRTSSAANGWESTYAQGYRVSATDGTYVIDTSTTGHSVDKLLRLVNTSANSVSVKVTAWVDANDNGSIDTNEYASPTRTVNFQKATGLTVATAMSPIIGDASLTARVTTTPVLNGDQVIAQDVDWLNVRFTRQGSTASLFGANDGTSSATSAWSDLTKTWTVDVTLAVPVTTGTTNTTTSTVVGGGTPGEWLGLLQPGTPTSSKIEVSTAGLVTVTTTGNHQLTSGDKITMAVNTAVDTTIGVAAESSPRTVTVVSATVFTYTISETTKPTSALSDDTLDAGTEFTVATYGSAPAYLTGRVFAGTYTAQAFVLTVAQGNLVTTTTASATSSTVEIASTASAAVQGKSFTAAGSNTALVKTGTLSVPLTISVTDANDAAVTAGRPVVITLSASGAAETFRVNGKATTDTVLTDASGKATVTITSLSGRATSVVQVTAVAEGVATADIDLEWQDQAYNLVDLAVTDSNYSAGSDPDIVRTILEKGSYEFNFGVMDQWFQPAAADTYRLKVLGEGVTPGLITLTNGRGTVKVTDSGVEGPELTSDVVLQKQTSGVWADVSTYDVTTNLVKGANVRIGANGSTLYSATAVDTSADVAEKALVELDKRTSTTAVPAYGTGKFVRLSGQVINSTTSAGLQGAVVTISGASNLLFVDTATSNVYKRGSLTFASNAASGANAGRWEVLVYSTTAQTDTVVTVTANGASSTTKISFTGTGVGEGTSLVVTTPANVKPASTFQVKAKLTDVYGNAVDTVAGRVKVTYTGPGIVFGTLPDQTDANGELMFSVLLGSNDTGNVVVTVSYDQNGDADFVDAKDLNTTKTIAVGTGAASGTGKVNVGSFNGKLVVYASGLNGARISWKVGGNWGSQVASSNYAIFNRPTPRAGVTVSVDIYVNGVKTLTKSVVTR